MSKEFANRRQRRDGQIAIDHRDAGLCQQLGAGFDLSPGDALGDFHVFDGGVQIAGRIQDGQIGRTAVRLADDRARHVHAQCFALANQSVALRVGADGGDKDRRATATRQTFGHVTCNTYTQRESESERNRV